jgi:hypothetical protein
MLPERLLENKWNCLQLTTSDTTYGNAAIQLPAPRMA